MRDSLLWLLFLVFDFCIPEKQASKMSWKVVPPLLPSERDSVELVVCLS